MWRRENVTDGSLSMARIRRADALMALSKDSSVRAKKVN
jgi:hypothetical protein